MDQICDQSLLYHSNNLKKGQRFCLSGFIAAGRAVGVVFFRFGVAYNPISLKGGQ
jgi:hypothetical protein